MNQKAEIKNFIGVAGANILSLAVGVLTGLIVPKLLSVEEFGYWQIFLLYINYIGLLHFGFNDGIYIKYGHYSYDELPKQRFRTYFTFLFIFQGAIALLLSLAAYFLAGDKIRLWIFIYVAFNMVLINLTTFFAFVNQITKRFSVYTRLLSASKIIYILAIAGTLFVNERYHIIYIIVHTIVNIITLAGYMYKSRDLVFGTLDGILKNLRDIINNITVGFFVMIGNFMALAIIGLDKLFVERFLTLRDFAMYSFAAAMISVVYLLLNAVSTAVYPYLTRVRRREALKILYDKASIIIFILSGFTMAGYFIFYFIVERFLPQYIPSMPITLLLFTTAFLKAKISIIGSNYYKALHLQKEYTFNNIFALLLGILTNGIAIIFLPGNISIAAASVLTFHLWYLYTEHYFRRVLSVDRNKETWANLFLSAAFIAIGVLVKSWYIGLGIYLFIFLIFIIVFYKEEIRQIMSKGTNYLVETGDGEGS